MRDLELFTKVHCNCNDWSKFWIYSPMQVTFVRKINALYSNFKFWSRNFSWQDPGGQPFALWCLWNIMPAQMKSTPTLLILEKKAWRLGSANCLEPQWGSGILEVVNGLRQIPPPPHTNFAPFLSAWTIKIMYGLYCFNVYMIFLLNNFKSPRFTMLYG